MVDFILGTVVYTGTRPETEWAIERARLAGLDHFVWYPFGGDALIGRARSILVTNFLEFDVPYLIMLDADIVFEPEDLHRLFDHLRSGYDLIGGIYVTRGGVQMAHYSRNQIHADGKIHKVYWLSTGFMGISRKLLLKIKDELQLPLLHPKDVIKCYPFFESGRYNDEQAGWIYISEDWDFCNKARAVGIEPYLDTSIMLGHIGTKEWRVRDMLEYQAKKETDIAPDPHQLFDEQQVNDAAAPEGAAAKEKKE